MSERSSALRDASVFLAIRQELDRAHLQDHEIVAVVLGRHCWYQVVRALGIDLWASSPIELFGNTTYMDHDPAAPDVKVLHS